MVPPISWVDGLGFRVLNFLDEKFALMDDFDGGADLLGQTGAQRKRVLQKGQRRQNEDCGLLPVSPCRLALCPC